MLRLECVGNTRLALAQLDLESSVMNTYCLHNGVDDCMWDISGVFLYQVENPIPFADPQTAKLTTGFLHAKYFHLLLFPWHLSADWSFACIPYVHSFSDPRNAATAALYAALLWVILAGRPWTVLSSILHGSQPAGTVRNPAQQADSGSAAADLPELNDKSSTDAEAKQADRRRQAVWQMVIVVGLMIGPFVPAANIFFYVGTFIGERLLYLPSVGYCIMLSHYLIKLMGPVGFQSLHAVMLCLGANQPAFAAGPVDCAGPAAPAVPAGASAQSVMPSSDSNTTVGGIAVAPHKKSTEPDAQQQEQQQQQPQQQQQQQQQVKQGKAETQSGRPKVQSDVGDARCGRRHVGGWVGLAVVGVLLVGYSWRTVIRNRDWQDEETLFLAAQKVTKIYALCLTCYFVTLPALLAY